jgi:hypothetical protein
VRGNYEELAGEEGIVEFSGYGTEIIRDCEGL